MGRWYPNCLCTKSTSSSFFLCRMGLRPEEVLTRAKEKVHGTRARYPVYKFPPIFVFIPSHAQDTQLCFHRSLNLKLSQLHCRGHRREALAWGPFLGCHGVQ